MTSFTVSLKIKIVGKRKTLLGAGLPSSAEPTSIRPYTMRVVRDNGGGLWTLEDNTGQLYLAVLSREVSDHRRARAEADRAEGQPYRWVSPTKRRRSVA